MQHAEGTLPATNEHMKAAHHIHYCREQNLQHFLMQTRTQEIARKTDPCSFLHYVLQIVNIIYITRLVNIQVTNAIKVLSIKGNIDMKLA